MTQDATPAIGIADPDEIADLSGLEIIARIGTGALPMPPMAAVLPMRPHAWELGAVEFRATPSARFFNPMGSVHGGWAMTMLDTAMGVAAHTTLKPGQTYASLDTSVRFVRPIMGNTGELRILGSVQSRGRRVITVNGRIENESGKLFALGTSACQITDPRSR